MTSRNTIKNLSGALLITASAILAGTALAREEYVEPTGAKGCTDCHKDDFGNGYLPGVLEASASPLGLFEGLREFLRKGAAQPTNTAPVLHPINPKWDVTVGEAPLVIPLQVTDKEDDSFALHGSAPSGYSTSKVYVKNNLPTIDFTWRPTAAQANKTYPVSLHVQETGDGSSLKSNTITATIQVWPARRSRTKQVAQFMLQAAQWKNRTLTLSGQIAFNSNVNAAQRNAALSNLRMSVTSANGKIISQPVRLTANNTGSWTRTITLAANKTPCTVVVSYEGLNASRPVSQAPSRTCVK
jgi:hypothetical protein